MKQSLITIIIVNLFILALKASKKFKSDRISVLVAEIVK